MEWLLPKTDYTVDAKPQNTDFNRIEGNTLHLKEQMDIIDDGTLARVTEDINMVAKLVAKGGSDYSVAQVRNIVIRDTVPTIPSGKSGTIYLVF